MNSLQKLYRFSEFQGTFDASGIENNHEWLWQLKGGSSLIWYPVEKIPDYQYYKDVAIATAYFSSLLVATDSFFNSIDKAHEMALEFVNKYPPETNWGEDLEYEETLSDFFDRKINGGFYYTCKTHKNKWVSFGKKESYICDDPGCKECVAMKKTAEALHEAECQLVFGKNYKKNNGT